MTLPLCFKSYYFVAAVILFFVEVLIALYAHDQIIRPYVGDMLVVILIYCFIKSFINTPVITTAVAVLIFAYAVEVLQYFKIVNLLGLQHSVIAKVVIGTSFEWIDLIAYTVGIAIVLLGERIFVRKNRITLQA
jgi:DNA integrity scanning protein DisA with diadenylate cyclase activity